MIEPDYISLSIQELRHLCDDRKIKHHPSFPAGKLIRMLLGYDYNKNVEDFNNGNRTCTDHAGQ